jgi:hypothetical protein
MVAVRSPIQKSTNQMSAWEGGYYLKSVSLIRPSALSASFNVTPADASGVI